MPTHASCLLSCLLAFLLAVVFALLLAFLLAFSLDFLLYFFVSCLRSCSLARSLAGGLAGGLAGLLACCLLACPDSLAAPHSEPCPSLLGAPIALRSRFYKLPERNPRALQHCRCVGWLWIASPLFGC